MRGRPRKKTDAHTFNFYAGPDFLVTWQKFKAICERESKSNCKVNVSQKLRSFIIETVQQHEGGNPQARIDIIMETGTPAHAYHCADCGRHASIKSYMMPGDLPILFCESCFAKRRTRLQGRLRGWQHLDV